MENTDSRVSHTKTAVDTPPPSHGGVRYEAAPARGIVKYIVVTALIVLVGAGGFAAGYGVAKGTGTTGSGNAGGFGSGQGFGQRRGGFGTVTAVSDSSITIEETGPGGMGGSSSSGGTTKTYTITSSTTVTSDGATASVGDIKTGDTVMIRTSSGTSTDATSIVINPSMGGAPGAATDSSTDSGTNTTTDGSTT